MIKNKKTPYLILTLLIIGTLLLISVGLSIWLITDNVEIKPEFDKDIIVEYLSSKETTYNGNIQLPLAEALNIDEDITEYRYKLVGEENYQVVDRDDSDGTLLGPINAGDYLLEVVYIQYTYEDENGNKVDSTVTVSGIDFKIKPRSLTDENVSASFTDNNFYYSGFEIEEIATSLNVKYKGKDLVKGTDYTVVFSETVEIGNNHTATITAVDNSNFTDSIEVKYNILPSTLELVISDDVPTVVVNGIIYYVFEFGKYNNDNFPMNDWITVQTSQGLVIENATVNYYYYKGLNGTYGQNQLDLSNTTLDIGYYGFKITASANGFTTVEKEIKVQIKKLDISSAIVTISQSFMYDGTAHTPEIDSIVCSNGTVVNLSELTAGAVTYSNNVDATSVAIKAMAYIEGSGNYEGTAVGKFDISSRPGYIEGVLSFAFTTPTTCSKTKFVEGEDISEFITGNPTATLNGVELSGVIVPVLEYPENSKNSTESVKIKYRYIPQKNSNGVYNVEETEVESTMSITLYAVAYNSISKIYYGTIKKAIGDADSTNNKVWVVPYDYDSVGYYPTIVEDITINSNITFGLAYMIKDGVVTEYKYFNDGDSYAAADSEANPSKLIINEGVTLTISSKATFTIGAFAGDAGVVSKASVVMNNGNIIVESSGVVNSYGFTKGNGTFYVKEGATVYDVLRIYDFAGARYAGGMYYKTYKKDGNITPDRLNNILPFQSYSMHNIACKLYIYTGATFYVRAHLNVSNTIYAKNITLFGSGGLFQMEKTAGKTENYIIRTVENTESTDDFKNGWNVTNQSIYQKEIYDINTSITDNSLHISISIDVKIAKAALNFNTDESTAMPIGMLDIILRDGHTMHIKTNSWKFLPGSGIYIDKGATLKIDPGINVIVYDEYYDNFIQYNDSGNPISPSSFSYYSTHSALYNTTTKKVKDKYVAKLYVDGLVECEGGLAAIIETRGITGRVILSSSSANLRRLKSIEYLSTATAALAAFDWQDMGGVVYDDVQSSKMKLYNGQTINDKYDFIGSGEYRAKEGQTGVYGWYSTEITIEYDLNGGVGENRDDLGPIIAPNGYTVNENDILPIIPNPTFTAYSYGKEIDGIKYYWALDREGTRPVIPGETELYASVVFYAIWEPDEYTIEYKNIIFPSTEVSQDNIIDVNPNPTTYTIKDTVLFSNQIIKYDGNEPLVLGGYYTDSSCSDEFRITSIIAGSGDKIIYVYWYPSDSTTITIDYNLFIADGVTEVTTSAEPNNEKGVIINSALVTSPASLDDWMNIDDEIDGYFTKWYFDEACTIEFNKSIAMQYINEETKTLSLYSIIKKKCEVVYYDEDGTPLYNGYQPREKYYELIDNQSDTKPYRKDDITVYVKSNTHWLYGSTEKAEGSTIYIEESMDKLVLNVPIQKFYKISISNSYTTTTISYTGSNCLLTEDSSGSGYVYVAGTSVEVSGTKAFYGKQGTTFNFNSSAEEGYQNATTTPESYTVGEETQQISVSSSAEKQGSGDNCIAAGTLITLADGTQKKVEDLKPDDLLLVFNHETGKYESANIILVDDDGWKEYDVLNLVFSDGSYVKVIYAHGFFDLDLNKYVYVDYYNYNEFIGHRFAVTDVVNGKYIQREVKLEEAYVAVEYVGCYSPITVYHMNYFTNGLLSMPAGIEGFFNIFEYNEDMTFNTEKMNADIEKYGLYTYEDFAEYVPYDFYCAFPAHYLKVSVGKGYMTYEQILALIDRYLGKILDYQ